MFGGFVYWENYSEPPKIQNESCILTVKSVFNRSLVTGCNLKSRLTLRDCQMEIRRKNFKCSISLESPFLGLLENVTHMSQSLLVSSQWACPRAE